jgi:hypothetical protein
MSKIELNSRDLQFKTLDDDRRVVQLKGSVAFDEDFQAECEEAGVKEYKKQDKEEDEE